MAEEAVMAAPSNPTSSDEGGGDGALIPDDVREWLVSEREGVWINDWQPFDDFSPEEALRALFVPTQHEEQARGGTKRKTAMFGAAARWRWAVWWRCAVSVLAVLDASSWTVYPWWRSHFHCCQPPAPVDEASRRRRRFFIPLAQAIDERVRMKKREGYCSTPTCLPSSGFVTWPEHYSYHYVHRMWNDEFGGHYGEDPPPILSMDECCDDIRGWRNRTGFLLGVAWLIDALVQACAICARGARRLRLGDKFRLLLSGDGGQGGTEDDGETSKETRSLNAATASKWDLFLTATFPALGFVATLFLHLCLLPTEFWTRLGRLVTAHTIPFTEDDEMGSTLPYYSFWYAALIRHATAFHIHMEARRGKQKKMVEHHVISAALRHPIRFVQRSRSVACAVRIARYAMSIKGTWGKMRSTADSLAVRSQAHRDAQVALATINLLFRVRSGAEREDDAARSIQAAYRAWRILAENSIGAVGDSRGDDGSGFGRDQKPTKQERIVRSGQTVANEEERLALDLGTSGDVAGGRRRRRSTAVDSRSIRGPLRSSLVQYVEALDGMRSEAGASVAGSHEARKSGLYGDARNSLVIMNYLFSEMDPDDRVLAADRADLHYVAERSLQLLRDVPLPAAMTEAGARISVPFTARGPEKDWVQKGLQLQSNSRSEAQTTSPSPWNSTDPQAWARAAGSGDLARTEILLIRPNTEFAVAWKAVYLLCATLEMVQLIIAPHLLGKWKKGTLAEVLDLLLLPSPECQEVYKREYYRTNRATSKFASFFSVNTTETLASIVDSFYSPPPTCKSLARWEIRRLKVLAWFIYRFDYVVSAVGFLDVVFSFLEGVFDARTGVLKPKPFFKRWISPGILSQLMMNPAMKHLSEIVDRIVGVVLDVGPDRFLMWFIALSPALKLCYNLVLHAVQ